MINAIFITGVSGSGKSTIGQLLSDATGIPFYDGDDYHPESNIDKMSSGVPLDDNDRAPWLTALNSLATDEMQKNGCIIACSALKESYRNILRKGIESSVRWVHLNGSFDQIRERLGARDNHFMPPHLLQSQFDTLEKSDEGITIDIKHSPEEIVDRIKENFMSKSEFGLFGLGVMGKSLSRNLARNKVKLSLFNRHVEGVEENVARDFIQAHDELSEAQPFDDIAKFVDSIEPPRKIMLMVNAGKTIDIVIDNLIPHLTEGDVLIDGGNANYNQTNERDSYLKSKGLFFIGTGVSGGEEGALKGPSIMPGGDKETYKKVAPILDVIAAKDKDGLPCCTYVGPQGSGHFVKMIHNGIEYAEMQLLCEVYGILRAMGHSQDEMVSVLTEWKASANSYLLEITIDILMKKEGEEWLLDKIMDKAGNKGTGNWATIASAQLGVPSTMIVSALYARYSSFYKDQRVGLDAKYDSSDESLELDIADLLAAYKFARIVNHYQGFRVIDEASKKYGWNLNLSEIARIWTNGCIIRSDLMVGLVPLLRETNDILSHGSIINELSELKPQAAATVAKCIVHGFPIPCFSEAINFFNGITTGRSTANMIQAQRDYFGAHTYQRLDDDSGKYYHTQWT